MSKMKEEDSDQNKRKSRPCQEKEESVNLWRILAFGLIGATATTIAVGKLRRTIDFVYAQFARSRESGGRSFQEEAWKKYNRRMQEEYEEEMERVERIRRMQSVFNRERNKYQRNYERWRENGQSQYHQHFQRDDWYWKTDTTHKDHKTNFRQTPRGGSNHVLSHHYAILGLDRYRSEPYSESEIKTAFRSKAKQFHPDQNQNNKAAEVKFKEVMTSYNAIKEERKYMKS